MSITPHSSRGQARRQAMLEAARDLFLERGYDQTSLSDVLERSKGSRTTLYENFGGKEGLLKAIIEDTSHRFWLLIDPADFPPPLSEERLCDLGFRFLKAAVDPLSLGILRLIQSEGPRSPEIAAFFEGVGPCAVEERIAEIFRHGLVFPGVDPLDLAVVFLWAVIGDTHVRHMAGMAPHWNEDEMRRMVAIRVRFFLHGAAGAAGASERHKSS